MSTNQSHDTETPYAEVTIKVKISLGYEPGQSNPIVGTEMPYEYLVIREAEAIETKILGDPAKVHILEFDGGDDFDTDGLMLSTVLSEVVNNGRSIWHEDPNNHWGCDCVPDLGPVHCHACSQEQDKEVPLTDCPKWNKPEDTHLEIVD